MTPATLMLGINAMNTDILLRHGISESNIAKLGEYVCNNDRNGMKVFLDENFNGIAMIDDESIVEYCFGDKCNRTMISLVHKWELSNQQITEYRNKIKYLKNVIISLFATIILMLIYLL